MLSVSSPVVYPPSSPPSRAKRAQPHDNKDTSRSQIKGGFIIDDDSDDENHDTSGYAEPLPKKRMLEHPASEPDSEPAAAAVAAASDLEGRLALLNSLTSANAFVSQRQDNLDSSKNNTLYHQSSTRISRASIFPGGLSGSSREYTAATCRGHVSTVKQRKTTATPSYESMAAARSKTKEGMATRSYYGVEILRLIDAAKKYTESHNAQLASSAEPATSTPPTTRAPVPTPTKKSLLWTEKYRARSFVDLCGDDGTNRLVLRWLKRWDPIVFPGAVARNRAPIGRRTGAKPAVEEERPHRKILMVTGPPGLGKTTLVHVCARQAGYEVLEVNASDDRSKDVVQNRIRTSLGTENVKTVANQKAAAEGGGKHKVARPVCLVVDEVDGAVGGSGSSGEGGFVKALIDLVLLDQRNSSAAAPAATGSRKKKGDDFRLKRPLILICNDVYHPSLRPLRQSGLAEIVHTGKPTIDAVAARLKVVLGKEGILCDKDAARILCEAAWGMPSGTEARRGAESSVEGDLRSVMVVGEWVAGRFRASSQYGTTRVLNRQWIEQNVLHGLAGAAGARGLGRSGTREIVNRIFQDGAGFPSQAPGNGHGHSFAAEDPDPAPAPFGHEQPKAQLGFSELRKRRAMEGLRQMVDASGEVDRVVVDIFTEYPNRDFNDDSYLSKPTQAYEWLHFHDACSSRLFSNQDWELAPYLSQASLACHHLFASSSRQVATAGYDRRWGAGPDEGESAGPPVPFSGPRADHSAFEAERHNRAQLQMIHGNLGPALMRAFRGPEHVAMDFLPYLVRLLSPDVKPVVVGGSQGWTASVRKESEKAMVKRAAGVLADVGISLLRGKIESDVVVVNRGPQYVYRLEPDLDALSAFETASTTLINSHVPTRYAVRQVLDQELHRTLALRESAARQARLRPGNASFISNISNGDSDHVAHDAGVVNSSKIESLGSLKSLELVKRDFFGRVIVETRPSVVPGGDDAANGDIHNGSGHRKRNSSAAGSEDGSKVWVTYNEGLNNAVRKPISIQEFMKGL